MQINKLTSIFFNKIGKLIPSRINSTWIDMNYSDFYSIESYTTDIREKIFAINNNINEKPTCICGNILPFKKTHYPKYCSKECSFDNKASDTAKGVLEKYGVDNYFKTNEFKKKFKEVSIDKYGTDHPMKNKEISEKVTKNTDYSEASKARKDTNIIKYGVENTYGLIKKPWNKGNKGFDFSNIDTASKSLNELSNISGLSYSHTSRLLGIEGYNFDRKSNLEESINSIFDNVFSLRNRKIIKPYELDLYSEEHKLAIEYDGLIWHSYGMSKHDKFNNYMDEYPNKHLDKTIMCEENNINLFHIFENEWLDPIKRNIWISKIRYKLNKHIKIPARKCIIKEVPTKEAREFLEKHHLQGYSNSSIKLGLYFNNILVQVMTIGKPRFNKNTEYELIRLASKINITVQGGASKLLKYFEREYSPKNIISYANRRWSQGNVYDSIGFYKINVSKPNFFYFKDKMILESRHSFQKHMLSKKLNNYNKSMSVKDNIYSNGYRKIYDCGNIVYLKEFK